MSDQALPVRRSLGACCPNRFFHFVSNIGRERTSGTSIMMGHQQPQKELFSYQVDLDKRVRSDHSLRRVAAAIDFTFARAEVQGTYGYNGNVSVDPAVVLKLMFLLFFDQVRSERHLLELSGGGQTKNEAKNHLT